MILALSVLALLLFWVYFSTLIKEDIVTLSAYSIFSFTAVYVIASGIFIWMDVFSVAAGVYVTLIVAAVLLLLRFLRKKRINNPLKGISPLQPLIPLAVFVCIAVLFFERFEFYGLGQDEGLYQLKAFLYVNDITANNTSLESLMKITDESARNEAFFSLWNNKNLTGFYPESYNYMTGTLHGVFTYPALLAWWGKMFGIYNIGYVNLAFLFVSICLLAAAVRSFGGGFFLTTSSTVVFAVAPPIIWVNKSYLSENVLIMLFAAFFALLAAAYKKRNEVVKEGLHDGDIIRLISAAPMCVMCFFHVSVYVFLPMFVCVFFFLFFKEKRRVWLICNVAVSAAYLAGLWMMRISNQTYTDMNYAFAQNIGIPQETIYLAFELFAVFSAVAGIFIIIVYNTIKKHKGGSVNKSGRTKEVGTVIFAWSTRAVLAIALGLSFKNIKDMIEYGDVNNIFTTSLYAYIAESALIIGIIVYFVMFFNPKIYIKSPIGISLVIMFIYAVILYSGIMQPETKYYYYYSRYETVWLSVILLSFAYALCHIRAGVIRKTVAVGVGIWAVVLYMPFLSLLKSHRADTRVTFSCLKEVFDGFSAGDTVIMDIPSSTMFYIYAEKICGLNVYPIINNDLDYTYSLVKNFSKNIYLINESSDEIEEGGEIALMGVEFLKNTLSNVSKEEVNINKERTVSATLDYMHDSSDITKNRLPYPVEYTCVKYDIDISRLQER